MSPFTYSFYGKQDIILRIKKSIHIVVLLHNNKCPEIIHNMLISNCLTSRKLNLISDTQKCYIPNS